MTKLLHTIMMWQIKTLVMNCVNNVSHFIHFVLIQGRVINRFWLISLLRRSVMSVLFFWSGWGERI